LLSITSALFHFTYAVSPLLATLTKTAGVWLYSSHFGSLSLPRASKGASRGTHLPLAGDSTRLKVVFLLLSLISVLSSPITSPSRSVHANERQLIAYARMTGVNPSWSGN
jgi:hypothetical protein